MCDSILCNIKYEDSKWVTFLQCSGNPESTEMDTWLDTWRTRFYRMTSSTSLRMQGMATPALFTFLIGGSSDVTSISIEVPSLPYNVMMVLGLVPNESSSVSTAFNVILPNGDGYILESSYESLYIKVIGNGISQSPNWEFLCPLSTSMKYQLGSPAVSFSSSNPNVLSSFLLKGNQAYMQYGLCESQTPQSLTPVLGIPETCTSCTYSNTNSLCTSCAPCIYNGSSYCSSCPYAMDSTTITCNCTNQTGQANPTCYTWSSEYIPCTLYPGAFIENCRIPNIVELPSLLNSNGRLQYRNPMAPNFYACLVNDSNKDCVSASNGNFQSQCTACGVYPYSFAIPSSVSSHPTTTLTCSCNPKNSSAPSPNSITNSIFSSVSYPTKDASTMSLFNYYGTLQSSLNPPSTNLIRPTCGNDQNCNQVGSILPECGSNLGICNQSNSIQPTCAPSIEEGIAEAGTGNCDQTNSLFPQCATNAVGGTGNCNQTASVQPVCATGTGQGGIGTCNQTDSIDPQCAGCSSCINPSLVQQGISLCKK